VTLARLANLLGVVAVTALALWLPGVLSPLGVTLFTTMGLSAMVAVGLSLLMGFAGQVSFGQGAFYALGAYTAGILSLRYGWPTIAALAVAPFATAAISAVVGVPLLRLRGHYLAFATLALHLILLALIFAWSGFTGGEIGLLGIPKLGFDGRHIGSDDYARLVWVFALLLAVAAALLVRSRAGRAMQALAVSESTAAASGIGVAGYKLRLFVLAGFYAGLAGGLYTFFLNYLSAESFPILISVQFVIMAAVGGMGSVWGAVLGSIGIVLLQHELQVLGTQPGMPAQAPQVLSIGVYGLILALVMLVLPRGIVPTAADVLRRLRGDGKGGRTPSPAPAREG